MRFCHLKPRKCKLCETRNQGNLYSRRFGAACCRRRRRLLQRSYGRFLGYPEYGSNRLLHMLANNYLATRCRLTNYLNLLKTEGPLPCSQHPCTGYSQSITNKMQSFTISLFL